MERDEQIRKLRDENVQDQRKLKQQLEEEMASAVELRDTVEQLSIRKEELKQQLLDKEAELDEVKETYRYGITLVTPREPRIHPNSGVIKLNPGGPVSGRV